MSLESAKALLERMKPDESFAKKVVAFKDAAARMALVKAEGFEFTNEEFKEAGAELSPEELNGVDGGTMQINMNLGADFLSRTHGCG